MSDPVTLDEYRSYLLTIGNRLIRSDLRTKAGGSDLVQETMLAAWMHTRSGTVSPDDLRLWLRGILRNQYGRVHRRYVTTAKRSVSSEQRLDDVKDTDEEPLDRDPMVHDESLAAMRVAVEKLRPHELEVLTLRICDDFSWQEIAQSTDSTEEAARKVFTRSLKQLRGMLSPALDPAG